MLSAKVFNNLIILLVLLFNVVNSFSSEFENESNNEHELPEAHVNEPRNHHEINVRLFSDPWNMEFNSDIQENIQNTRIETDEVNWNLRLFKNGTLKDRLKGLKQKEERKRGNATRRCMLRSPYINDRSPSPRYFDWRDHGAVSPPKDQEQCAACWAFSVIGNIESMNMIYNNKKVRLSEKYLMDCLPNTNGCEDTSLLQAYSSIITTIGGVVREDDYQPYNEQKDQCTWVNPPQDRLVHVSGFQRVRQDEVAMVEALVKHGPLSAAINSKSMENYKTNARHADYIDEPTEEQCSSDPKDLNHAILIVGYNEYVDSNGHSTPYWIIKNSWGDQWGDGGYYYLVRGRNACGIANDVSFAYVN